MSTLVYNLAQTETIDQIVDALDADPDRGSRPSFQFKAIENFPHMSVRDVVRFHENKEYEKTTHLDSFGFEDYCLIVDRLPVEKHGILVVCLDFDGAPDALRMPVNVETGMALASLQEFNTDWLENREVAVTAEEAALRPDHDFALYNLIPEFDEKDEESGLNVFEAITRRLESGMELICMKGKENYSDRLRPMYVGITGDGKDLKQIKANHVAVAKEKGLDSTFFAVLDSQWKKEGLLFVRLAIEGNDEDQFRHRGPKTGELLCWIWTGLLNWEEAKAEVIMEWPQEAQHPLAI
ncbi:MAG: hypothetical protein Q9227_009260 [Pyrenula ochraceoflavens]